MRTQRIEIYQFNELSDDAKEKAIQRYREGNLDYEWYDGVFEDAKEIGKLIGIDIDRIYFSGFCSQGDGACFEGSYEYRIGSVKEIKKYAPKDKELHRIAVELSKIQRKSFYGLTARVKHFGAYSHELCTQINVYGDFELGDRYYVDFVSNEEGIIELLRDFMKWIYKSLEADHDWLNADEQVIESMECNEYEFLENGSRA